MKRRWPANTVVAVVSSTAMIAQQVAGKATRDALYLSSFHATTLPPVMAAAALFSLAAAVGMSRVMSRYTPARVVPIGFGASAVILVVLWLSSAAAPRFSAVALYLYTGLFSAAMISAFWSLINETFDPHTSRRAITAITSGGTLGGLVGALAAWGLASTIAVRTMLPLLAVVNGVCMACTWTLARRRGRPAPRVAASELEPIRALRVLREAPYLRDLAAIVALGAVTQGLLDYVFSAEASKSFADSSALLAFFGEFWVVVGVLSFVRQVAFGTVALKRLGLSLTMSLVPATVFVGALASLAVPGLPTASALRGGEAMQRNTFFRSAYEMLYTALSPRQKRAIKTVIDVGFDRLGTLVAAGLAWCVVALAGAGSETVLVATVLTCAVLTLARSRPLHRGYVAALENRLRRGAKSAAPSGAHPPDHLDDRLEFMPTHVRPGPSVAVRPPHDRQKSRPSGATPPAVARARRALLLEAPLTSRETVAFAIQGLASDELREVAIRVLRRDVALIAEQLAEALCDPRVDAEIRRSVPPLLSSCPTQHVADALLRGAEDVRFDVRYECGRALLQVTATNPRIVIAHDRIIAIVKVEVSLERTVWEGQPPSAFDDEAARSESIATLLRNRLDRSLHHIFNLLALELDRTSIAIAFEALHSGDQPLRGTAFEYLETVLPHEVRDVVWPYLGEERPMRRARDASELLTELRLFGAARNEN